MATSSDARTSAPPSSPPLVATRRARRPGRSQLALQFWALVFIAPVGFGLGVFYVWPVIQTLYFSFTSWGSFGGHTWSGLSNYRRLIHDSAMRSALWNTVLYALIGLAGIPLSIFLASLINRPGLRGVAIYRTLYFLPVVTMPTAVAIVWGWMYNGDYGLINFLLGQFGVHGLHWTSDGRTALYAVAVVGLWSSLGYSIIIFSAGLQNIPREYYEASAIEGASWFRQLVSITLPLLTPSIFFVTVLSIIGSFQLFDVVYVMVGPQNPALAHARTIVYLFYQNGFIDNDRGYAAAIAFALLVLIVLFTLAQFGLQRRWVHYE